MYQQGPEFRPADIAPGEHLSMQIMQPLNSAGSLEQALQASYNEAAALYKGVKMNFAGGEEYRKEELQKSFNGWEYIQGKGAVQIANATPYADEYGLDVFVIKINNRYERVAVLKLRKNCDYSKYYTADLTKYENAINKFLFNLHFTDGPEPLLQKPGNVKGSGIVGVWQGISLSVGTSIKYKVFSPV